MNPSKVSLEFDDSSPEAGRTQLRENFSVDQSPNDGHQNDNRENKIAKVILLSRKLLTRENILFVLVAYAVLTVIRIEAALTMVKINAEITNLYLRDLDPRIKTTQSAVENLEPAAKSIISEVSNIQSELQDMKWEVERIKSDVDSIHTLQLTGFRKTY